MATRRRTNRLRKRGGTAITPASDTPYCDIEFPLELRKWRAMDIHEPTLLADYTMSEAEFWERANRVASHYEDCSERVSNDRNSKNTAYAIEKNSKWADQYRIRGFIERVRDLNPRKSPHNRWVYDDNNKYVLLRAVREAERQCIARRTQLKKNSNNKTAKNKQNKINATEKKQQFWNTYNRTKRANLKIDEVNEIKRYFKSFSGKGSILEGTQDVDFDIINRLLEAEDKVGVTGYVNLLRKPHSVWEMRRQGIEPPQDNAPHSKERSEIIGKLADYTGLINNREHLKPSYNRSNIERNKYYEEKRAKELEGLF